MICHTSKTSSTEDDFEGSLKKAELSLEQCLIPEVESHQWLSPAEFLGNGGNTMIHQLASSGS
jgi:hypothetical protein